MSGLVIWIIVAFVVIGFETAYNKQALENDEEVSEEGFFTILFTAPLLLGAILHSITSNLEKIAKREDKDTLQ